MKNYSKITLILFLFSSLIFQFSCKPEAPDGGEEEITTVTLTFTGGPVVSWKEGEATPTITLEANKTYTVKASFLNESDPNDVEDITEEIRAENDEHIICYEISGGADLSISRTDSDGQYEVGLDTEWQTGAASTGNVNLILRHQPGVKDGSCTAGDSDVEVDFSLEIQ